MLEQGEFESTEETNALPRFPGVAGAGKGASTSSSFGDAGGAANCGGRPSRADRIASGEITGRPAKQNWALLSVTELIRFRDEITRELPPIELSKVNLEEEVLLQFHSLRELQSAVMGDDDVPVKQRAQFANTIGATLKTLGDLQIALYSSERFKQIENALIRQLDKLPEELAASFLDAYAKILAKYGK